MPDFVMDPRVLTPDQMREHVLAYTQPPHGLKKRYLARHGLTQYWMRKWSRAMKAGDLDAAIYPHDTVRVSNQEAREMTRLRKENAQLKRLLREEKQRRVEEVDKRDQTIEILGKAIGVMQSHGAESRSDM